MNFGRRGFLLPDALPRAWRWLLIAGGPRQPGRVELLARLVVAAVLFRTERPFTPAYSVSLPEALKSAARPIF